MFGERIPKKDGKHIEIWHSLEVLHFGPFGLSTTTKCSTMSNGMSLRSSTISGMNSSFMPRWLGNE